MKKVIYSIATVAFAQIASVILGFIVQRELLLQYGSVLNGLGSSVTQVMMVLLLVDFGTSVAATQSLYEPLFMQDNSRIKSILLSVKKRLKISSILFIFLLIISTILMTIQFLSQVDYATTILTTIIIGLGNAINLYFIAKYRIIFTADRDIATLSLTTTLSLFLVTILRLAVIYLQGHFVMIQFTTLIGVLFNYGFLAIMYRQKYRKLDSVIPETLQPVSNSWSVFNHQLVGVIHSNTDILILTVSSELALVSVYTMYYMIYNYVMQFIINTLINGTLAFFGRIYVKSKEVFHQYFSVFEFAFILFSHIVIYAVIETVVPFVVIYTRGIIDINYIRPTLALLFAISALLNLSRQPSIILINVMGLYQNTVLGANVEAFINLIISIPLFAFFGIEGLLIGTVCSLLYRTLEVIYITHQEYVFADKFQTYLIILVNSIIFFVLDYLVNVETLITGYLSFFTTGVIVFITSALVFILINAIVFRSLFNRSIELFKLILSER